MLHGEPSHIRQERMFQLQTSFHHLIHELRSPAFNIIQAFSRNFTYEAFRIGKFVKIIKTPKEG